jgi:hypothetical protein
LSVDRNKLIASLAALNFSSALLNALAQAQANESGNPLVSIAELVPLLSHPEAFTTFRPYADNFSIPTLSIPYSVKMINPLMRLPPAILNSMMINAEKARNGTIDVQDRENLQGLLQDPEKSGELSTFLRRLLETSHDFEPILASSHEKREALSSTDLLSRMGMTANDTNYEPVLAVNPFDFAEENGMVAKRNETKIKVELLKLLPDVGGVEKSEDEPELKSANENHQQALNKKEETKLEGPTLAMAPSDPEELVGEDVEVNVPIKRVGQLEQNPGSAGQSLKAKEGNEEGTRAKFPTLASLSTYLRDGDAFMGGADGGKDKADFASFDKYVPGLSSDKVKLLKPYEPVIASEAGHANKQEDLKRYAELPKPQLASAEQVFLIIPSPAPGAAVKADVSKPTQSSSSSTPLFELLAPVKQEKGVQAKELATSTETPNALTGGADLIFAYRPESRPSRNSAYNCPENKDNCLSEAEFIGENQSPTLRKRINNFFRRVVGRGEAAEKKTSPSSEDEQPGSKNNALIAAALSLVPGIALASMGRDVNRRKKRNTVAGMRLDIPDKLEEFSKKYYKRVSKGGNKPKRYKLQAFSGVS